MLTSFLRPKHEGDSSAISSAYNKHPMNKGPMYSPYRDSRRRLIRLSTKIANKHGDRTPPCQTPHRTGKLSLSIFCYRTQQCNWLYQLISNSTKQGRSAVKVSQKGHYATPCQRLYWYLKRPHY